MADDDTKYELNEQGLPPFERAMVIMAHPDDPEFFVGGTTALLAQQGVQVRVLLLTDGAKGSDDREVTQEQLVATRHAEQIEATKRLGGADVVFLDYPDGELEHTQETIRAVVREIRRYQPQLVLTNDPQRFYYESGFINHRDHRNAGAITIDAVFPAARNHRYFPEVLVEGHETWYVRELWLAAPLEGNHDIIIEPVIESKINAVLAHVSQVGDGEGVRKWMTERADDAEPFREKFKRIQL